MKPVCVCRSCGRTIEKEFLYCPWCGKESAEFDSSVIDRVFERIEQQQSESREQHIKRMADQLDSLEKDLSVLALSAEMHK